MHPFIRTAFAYALFLFCFATQFSFAGSGSVKPVSISFLNHKDIEKLNSFLSVHISGITVKKQTAHSPEETVISTVKICSCQVLNLESSNYDHRYVVLLAEKKNDGNGAAYVKAKNRIQREKKHLKQMFYDKVKVISEMQGTGTCESMFIRLRAADSSLQLYEILNADIN